MKQLTETDIIRSLREEWDARVGRLRETVGLTLNVDVDEDDTDEEILSADLKVTHTESGIRYTIDSVGPHDVVLLTPEGERFLVNKEEFEKEYELS